MKATRLILLATFATAAVSCQKSEQTADPAPSAETTAIFNEWFTDTAPEGAGAIHEVRTTAVPGDEITISGLVMGRMKPFVDGRAAFILGDPALLTPCNEIPGDECETPWDVCCDAPEAKREGTATIQITGPDGRVLSTPLKDVRGLKELSKVTVTGIVDPSSTPEALIINATTLHVAE